MAAGFPVSRASGINCSLKFEFPESVIRDFKGGLFTTNNTQCE